MTPARQPAADQVLSQLSSAERDSAELLSCPDGRRLTLILGELTSCAEDQQQRSWRLHSDEPAIVEYLQELTTILVSRHDTVGFHDGQSPRHYRIPTAAILVSCCNTI